MLFGFNTTLHVHVEAATMRLDATSLIRMERKGEWANERARRPNKKRLKLEVGEIAEIEEKKRKRKRVRLAKLAKLAKLEKLEKLGKLGKLGKLEKLGKRT